MAKGGGSEGSIVIKISPLMDDAVAESKAKEAEKKKKAKETKIKRQVKRLRENEEGADGGSTNQEK